MDDTIERLKRQNCLWHCQSPSRYVALLTSGKISNGFLNLTNLFYDQRGIELLGIMVSRVWWQIMNAFTWRPVIDYVVSPAYGAIVPGFMLSQMIGCGFVWSKKQDGRFTFPFGWHLPERRKVFLLEDIITTGGTINKLLADCVEENHSYIVGLGCLVNRSGGKSISGFPVFASAQIEFEVYDSLEASPWSHCEAIRPKHSGNWQKLINQE